MFQFACGKSPSTPSTTPRKHVYKAAVRTPLIKLDLPFASADGPAPEIYLKLESLQPIGSFKIRGAWNAVRKLTPEQMQDGVWTVSAGNAAQGVAFAARLAGVPCSVMVMDTAPQTKLRAIEQLGATIVKASLRRVLADRRIARLVADARPLRASVRRR